MRKNGRDRERRPGRRRARRTAVTCMTVCFLLACGGRAYARDSPPGETPGREKEERIRLYSEAADSPQEAGMLPEIYEDWDGRSWRLISEEMSELPVTGRRREVAGEVTYAAVTADQEIPQTARMQIADEESGRTVTAELPLDRTEWLNERWESGYSFTVTFHEYGSDRYRIGETTIAHEEERPPLAECEAQLLRETGLSGKDLQIEAYDWAGAAYRDEKGVLCRDALVTAARRVRDCRAVYRGEADLPDYTRYRRMGEYEPVLEESVSAAAAPAAATPAEALPVPPPEQAAGEGTGLERWIYRAVTVTVSLLLLAAAAAGFRQLRRRILRDKKGTVDGDPGDGI